MSTLRCGRHYKGGIFVTKTGNKWEGNGKGIACSLVAGPSCLRNVEISLTFQKQGSLPFSYHFCDVIIFSNVKIERYFVLVLFYFIEKTM